MNIPFDKLKEDSRIWIFQADRKLSEKEQEIIKEVLHVFTSKWAAHGKSLSSSYTLLNDIHVIVGLDLTVNEASGCSIDALTHKIQELGRNLNVDFFDRKSVAFKANGEVQVLSYEEANNAIKKGFIKADTEIFNNLIDSKDKIFSEWVVPAEKSWLRRVILKNSVTT